MKKLIYGFLSVMLAGFVLAAVVSTDPAPVKAVDGSITFSHEKHKDLAECSTCHAAAAESVSASDNLRPKAEVCASCHEAADVRKYWNLAADAVLENTSLPARDHKLIFSHKFHTTKAGMNCQSCHGAVLASEGSGLPSMETCANCHNNANKIAPIIKNASEEAKSIPATGQCEACHTSLAGMMPKNHRGSNWRQLHGKLADDGSADRECATCHSAGFCQSCHTPTNDVSVPRTADKYYLDAHPLGEKMDDGRLLTVQQVHSLTYRYTHGFDARAQSSRCATCHETESFCVSCHENGYDANGVRVVPQSHLLSGFVTIGGSSAMNRHGKMAEMDLEACATCHHVEGGDPICAKCHESGIVKGGIR
jgi:ssDNA-binding Zn-finger/Zn-ribbon topoisomerase 1